MCLLSILYIHVFKKRKSHICVNIFSNQTLKKKLLKYDWVCNIIPYSLKNITFAFEIFDLNTFVYINILTVGAIKKNRVQIWPWNTELTKCGSELLSCSKSRRSLLHVTSHCERMGTTTYIICSSPLGQRLYRQQQTHGGFLSNGEWRGGGLFKR